MIDERSLVDAINLDFAMAFEYMPQGRLLKKDETLGIEDDTLQWMKYFLVGRRQKSV